MGFNEKEIKCMNKLLEFILDDTDFILDDTDSTFNYIHFPFYDALCGFNNFYENVDLMKHRFIIYVNNEYGFKFIPHIFYLWERYYTIIDGEILSQNKIC